MAKETKDRDVFISSADAKIAKIARDMDAAISKVAESVSEKLWDSKSINDIGKRLMGMQAKVHEANMRGDVKRADELVKRMEAMSVEIISPKSMKDMVRNMDGVTKSFGEGLHGAFQTVKNKDIDSMIGAFGKVGQAAAAAGQKMETTTRTGAAGKATAGLGSFLTVAGPMVASIAMVAAGFMAMFKIVMDADAQVKGLNKDILQMGASEFATDLGHVSAGLTTVRQSFIGLVGSDAFGFVQEWGVSAKENLAILNAFSGAGMTIREITKGIKDEAIQQERLREATSLAMTYSKLVGETNEKVAGDMAEMAESMGVGLNDVANSFSDIADAAQESAFGVKRFYGMVLQITSGMSMYNVRLEDTLGMLGMLGKLMDPRKASEYISSLTKGFKDASTEERLVTGMKMGKKNLATIGMQRSVTAAASFQGTAKGGTPEQAAAVAAAMAKYGLDPNSTADAFAEQSSKLTQAQTDALTFALNEIKATLGTQFSAQQRASMGRLSGAGARTAAMKEYDPASMVKQTLVAASGVTGKRLDQISQKDLVANMAEEKVGGKSISDREAALQIARHAKGMQEEAKRLGKEGTASEIAKFNETAGKEFNVAIDPVTKKLTDLTGTTEMSGDSTETLFKLIDASMETSRQKAEKDADGAKKAQEQIEAERKSQIERDREVAKSAVDAVTTMSDHMESVIEGLLETIADGVKTIVGWLPGVAGKADRKAKAAAMDEITESIRRTSEAMASAKDPEERAELKKQIDDYKNQRRSIRKDDKVGLSKDAYLARSMRGTNFKSKEMYRKGSAVSSMYAQTAGQDVAGFEWTGGEDKTKDELSGDAYRRVTDSLNKESEQRDKKILGETNDKQVKEQTKGFQGVMDRMREADSIAKALSEAGVTDSMAASRIAGQIMSGKPVEAGQWSAQADGVIRKRSAVPMEDGMLTYERGGRREFAAVADDDVVDIHHRGGKSGKGGSGSVTVYVQQWGDVPGAVVKALETMRVRV